jgi:hypothetical protein
MNSDLFKKELLCIYRFHNLTKRIPLYYSYDLSWFTVHDVKRAKTLLFPLWRDARPDRTIEVYRTFSRKVRISREI